MFGNVTLAPLVNQFPAEKRRTLLTASAFVGTNDAAR
jgi:hypothetical protein